MTSLKIPMVGNLILATEHPDLLDRVVTIKDGATALEMTQSFTPDETANISRLTLAKVGTTTLDQTRTHNIVDDLCQRQDCVGQMSSVRANVGHIFFRSTTHTVEDASKTSLTVEDTHSASMD